MINQYNEKGEKHGYWEWYWPNNKLAYKGNYINDEEDGYWEEYWSNGQLWTKGYYKEGEYYGYWEWYEYYNVKLTDKSFHII